MSQLADASMKSTQTWLMRCKRALPLLAAFASFTSIAAESDQSWSALNNQLNDFGIDGSLRGSYWSSNKLLDDENGVANAMLWARFRRKISDNVGVSVSGHFGVEGAGEHNKDRDMLREAYADLRFGQWDFRLGKQIIAWGRADRLNPTDNLTPRDFTLLVPEEDDNRFGSVALNAKYMLGDGKALQAVWLPRFSPYRYPVPLPAGFGVERDIPDGSNNYAIKFERSGAGVDWSISYFTGYDLVPDWRFNASALPAFVAQAQHNRIQVLGLDGATTAGAYGVRWELAYTRTKDRDGNNPDIKNPFFYGVVGLERTFMENLNVNVQLYSRYITKFSDPANLLDPILRAIAEQSAISSNQSKQHQYGLTTRISKKWWNDTLEAEFAVIYNLSPTGYMLRPKVTYAFTDQLKGTFGAEYYGGSANSFFGNLDKNRAVFAEMAYWF
jgi:hypothetical protein